MTQQKLPLTNLVTVLIKFIPNRVVRPDLQPITVSIDMLDTLDAKQLKVLWDIEHLINALPSATRVHVDVEEQKEHEKTVTARYVRKQFTSRQPMRSIPIAKFLDLVIEEFINIGHLPRPWTKGRWGFHTTCRSCGAHVSATKTTRTVREFPDDTCKERMRLVNER